MNTFTEFFAYASGFLAAALCAVRLGQWTVFKVHGWIAKSPSAPSVRLNGGDEISVIKLDEAQLNKSGWKKQGSAYVMPVSISSAPPGG